MARRKGPGAPPGNMNGLKTGSTLSRKRLVVGELPKAMIAVKREARAYRRSLEQALLDVKGCIDLVDAHVIDAAVGATMAAGVCRWLLRNRFGQMSVADITRCNQQIATAKKDRANIVRTLGLDAPPKNPWEIDVNAEDEGEDDDAD